MNDQKLQQKRRKRQAKRAVAQVRARRRGEVEKVQREKALAALNRPKVLAAPADLIGGVGRRLRGLFGGVSLTPDQMDAQAAPIVVPEG